MDKQILIKFVNRLRTTKLNQCVGLWYKDRNTVSAATLLAQTILNSYTIDPLKLTEAWRTVPQTTRGFISSIESLPWLDIADLVEAAYDL